MTESGNLDKCAWRKRMRALRRAVPPAERDAAGRDAADRLLKWAALPPRGAWVAAYLALDEELPTSAVIAALHDAGRWLAVPVWSARERCYRFAEWRPGARLVDGPMGVSEPAARRWVPTERVDLFLVPGLAFDRTGGRIGYGGGHYDRLLAGRLPGALCVALGYAWQLVEALPQTASDIRMDWVLTPRAIVKVGQAVPTPPASREGSAGVSGFKSSHSSSCLDSLNFYT